MSEEENKDAEDGPLIVQGEQKVGQMKKGDYMIHVYLEETRALKIEGEDTVDPFYGYFNKN
jgi:hypothetical protein